MATKIIAASGGDYSDFPTYITYLKTLGTLTATETGQISGEVDGGFPDFSGAGCTPTASFNLVIEAVSGGKFSGNPMRYGDGARVLCNGTSETFSVGWDNTTVRNIAIKKTTTGQSGSYLGALSVHATGVTTIQNVIVESDAIGLAVFDDRTQSASAVRESIIALRTTGGNGSSWPAFYLASTAFGPPYKNCVVGSVGTAVTSGTGISCPNIVATLYNCVVFGHPTDCTASESGSNNATDIASGSSAIPSTNAVYSLNTATAFENVTSPNHDLRAKSGGALIDAGTSANGTTLDILGNAVSGSARDIGAHEYQAAAASGAFPFKIKSVEGGGMQNLGGMTKR